MIRQTGPECKRSKCAYVEDEKKCISCNTMKKKHQCLSKKTGEWCTFTKGKCVFKPKNKGINKEKKGNNKGHLNVP
jgi:hypothetical protein